MLQNNVQLGTCGPILAETIITIRTTTLIYLRTICMFYNEITVAMHISFICETLSESYLTLGDILRYHPHTILDNDDTLFTVQDVHAAT